MLFLDTIYLLVFLATNRRRPISPRVINMWRDKKSIKRYLFVLLLVVLFLDIRDGF